MRRSRAGIVRLTDFESALARLPALGWYIEQPQQCLRYSVGKLLLDDGRRRDAERYFRSFQPYDYFYTSPAELYLARFARWWQHADEVARRAFH